MSKNWSNDDCELAIQLHNSGLSFYNIAIELDRTKDSVRCKLNKLGFKDNCGEFHIEKECDNCGFMFTSLISENRKFCSHSCSATVTNKKRGNNHNSENLKTKKCLHCGKQVANKYCSNICQGEHKRQLIFDAISSGDTTFHTDSYRRYMINKYGDKCMECGWAEINPVTGNVPIQLEHIDGNSDNNSLENLKLLCPNCHSLTPTYGSLNKGYGRTERRIRRQIQ